MAPAWNPAHYLQFAGERTRPAVDLVSRVQVESPWAVVDLGCGPGNSSAVLRARWPGARLIGVDSSPDMIEAARAGYPEGEWLLADLAQWTPRERFGVVFSNATLQWLPQHGPLVQRLFGHVAESGALAFQIPSAAYALVRTLIHEIAAEGAWATRMAGPLRALTMESPEFYYDHLASLAHSVDVWETDYVHVMPSPSAIVEWIASTGLRPFLAALDSEADRQEFVRRLQERVTASYRPRRDGKVLFPFRRLFVVAYRGEPARASAPPSTCETAAR